MSNIRTEALDKLVSELEQFEIKLNDYYGDLEPQSVYDSLLSGKLDALSHFCQTLGWSELSDQLQELLPLQCSAPEAMERVQGYILPEIRRFMTYTEIDSSPSPTASMRATLDLSAIDIEVRAQLCRDLFSRLATLLHVHCTGSLLILFEQVDEAYIRLRRFVEDILHTDGFESLFESYPDSIIPDSLHSLGEDADIDWEHGIQQAINKFTGEILEFCISEGAAYSGGAEVAEVFEKGILEPYDRLVESFRKRKRESERRFLDKAEVQANQFKQQFASASRVSEVYVNLERIKELRTIKSDRFDLSKLIELCEELNTCSSSECYLAVGMLLRAVLDHVSPIFGCKAFAEVANNYSSGSKSFKQSMTKLENSLRKIADAYLHTQIRKKESLPNKTQVNFSNDLDVLLEEIARILK